MTRPRPATMTRIAAGFAAGLGLAACAAPDNPRTPYAPALDASGTAVDGLVVGHRLMEAGQYELALDAYRRAAADRGLTVEILAALGTVNLSLGRLNQSEKLLRRALKADATQPEIWNNLGVVLMERGKTAEAERMFHRAYALDNGRSDSIRDNLRLALAKNGTAGYAEPEKQDFKLVRHGSSVYIIRRAS